MDVPFFEETSLTASYSFNLYTSYNLRKNDENC
nr:MAG TPA: hypothetical protein [Caudoviricetes sp.]